MYTTGYCPNGHKVAEAIPESVNHVKVAHHVGYGEDEFTLQDSYNYMYEFLVKGAPLVLPTVLIFRMKQYKVRLSAWDIMILMKEQRLLAVISVSRKRHFRLLHPSL